MLWRIPGAPVLETLRLDAGAPFTESTNIVSKSCRGQRIQCWARIAEDGFRKADAAEKCAGVCETEFRDATR